MTFINQLQRFELFTGGLSPGIRFKGSENSLYRYNIEPRKDSFNTNPLYSDLDERQIEKIARSNSKIMAILDKYNISLKINSEELEKLKHGHLMNTRVTAAKIYSALNQELKSEVNLSDLQQAAMLHDYGKILIPEKILNKSSTLTANEREIIELHSELGYELLKSQGVKPEVLTLVKYHHQIPSTRGYPEAGNDFEYSITSQILTAADKYSALTEKRSYKDALSKDDALKIIQNDVDKGLICREVFDALKQVV